MEDERRREKKKVKGKGASNRLDLLSSETATGFIAAGGNVSSVGLTVYRHDN